MDIRVKKANGQDEKVLHPAPHIEGLTFHLYIKLTNIIIQDQYYKDILNIWWIFWYLAVARCM